MPPRCRLHRLSVTAAPSWLQLILLYVTLATCMRGAHLCLALLCLLDFGAMPYVLSPAMFCWLCYAALSCAVFCCVQGALAQARFALKPDGLFLGAMLGGQTLQVGYSATQIWHPWLLDDHTSCTCMAACLGHKYAHCACICRNRMQVSSLSMCRQAQTLLEEATLACLLTAGAAHCLLVSTAGEGGRCVSICVSHGSGK